MTHDVDTYRTGCRCLDCRAAWAGHVRRIRRNRYAERHLVAGRWMHRRARHGTPHGYQHYGCRCPHCTTANTNRKATR